MKKIILAISFLAFMAACSNNEKKADDITIDYSNAAKDYADDAVASGDAAATTESDAATSEAGGEDPGLAMIEASDCLACHKVDAKVIGPSYKDVAAKYTEADTEMLARKIIDGGSGNWGEVPMTPHPDINMQKAETIVKYILSLK